MKNFKTKLVMVASTIAILSSSVLPVSAAGIDNHSVEAFQNKETYVFEEEVTTFSDLGIMHNALQEFISQNPDSTEAEQEAFLIQFVENGDLRRARSTRGVGDYIPGYNNLNAAERELLKEHPIQAVKVFDCANKATSATIEYYGSSGWQDNSDAFRHCCWNALMTKEMDASAAEAWATAHEFDSSGIDKDMDLFNNSVGRSISVSGKTDSQIYEAVKTKVKNGNCRRIVNNKLVATDGTGLIK